MLRKIRLAESHELLTTYINQNKGFSYHVEDLYITKYYNKYRYSKCAEEYHHVVCEAIVSGAGPI